MREYSVGRLNGRFVVTWDDNGKRRRFRLSALTRKEAEAEALTIIRRETRGSKAQKTVRAVWQDYCDEHAGRPATSNMSFTGLPILAHFGALLPDQITGADSNEVGQGFRTSAGQSFQFHAGRGSDLKPAILGTGPGSWWMFGWGWASGQA